MFSSRRQHFNLNRDSSTSMDLTQMAPDRSYTQLGTGPDPSITKTGTKMPNSSILSSAPSHKYVSRTNNIKLASSDNVSSSSFAALPDQAGASR